MVMDTGVDSVPEMKWTGSDARFIRRSPSCDSRRTSLRVVDRSPSHWIARDGCKRDSLLFSEEAGSDIGRGGRRVLEHIVHGGL